MFTLNKSFLYVNICQIFQNNFTHQSQIAMARTAFGPQTSVYYLWRWGSFPSLHVGTYIVPHHDV